MVLETVVSLQSPDLVQRHISAWKDLSKLPEKAAIHLNDTHPAVAVAELKRTHEASLDSEHTSAR